MYSGTKVRRAKFGFLPDYLPSRTGRGEAPAEKYFSTKKLTPLGIAHEGDDVCIYVTLDLYEYLVASEKYFSTKMVTPLGIEPRSPRPQRGILTTKLWRLSTLSTRDVS